MERVQFVLLFSVILEKLAGCARQDLACFYERVNYVSALGSFFKDRQIEPF